MTTIQSLANKHNEELLQNNNVFRFKFNDELCSYMAEFARIHKNEARNDFKENFDLWFNENNEIIHNEQSRLSNIGFNDNIKTKIFRSIKYYYAKKNAIPNNPKQRNNKYMQLNKDFINNTSDFIIRNCISQNISPKKSYETFTISLADSIDIESSRLINTYNVSIEEAHEKIKKNFKNIFFQISYKKKQNKQNEECIIDTDIDKNNQ
tara:strand:- start:355 stop:978 length:624 start_codon:yes stop_codon:yes gene_type:complete